MVIADVIFIDALFATLKLSLTPSKFKALGLVTDPTAVKEGEPLIVIVIGVLEVHPLEFETIKDPL